MIYTAALKIAERLRLTLRDYCERVEIAGSIRRKSAQVHDIELVALPKLHTVVDMFGGTSTPRSQLDLFPWPSLGQVIKNGPRFKQIAITRKDITLDLFVVLAPAQWGVLYTLRTGPKDFSQWCVTRRNVGGALPSDSHVENGVVLKDGFWQETGDGMRMIGGDAVPMPEEQDFLDYLGLGWIEPSARKAGWRYAKKD